MKFCHYMKQCRERYGLTQEELVQHLFNYDDNFNKLDVGTLSRWERGITCPSLTKQSKFIEALRHFDPLLFPGFDLFDFDELKQTTTQFDINKFLGKHKRYILEFPKDLLDITQIEVTDMKSTPDFDSSLKLTYELHKKISQDYSSLTLEQFKLWASYTNSFFLLASYENHFFGMFFSLRLKPEPFNALMNFTMTEHEITLEHFADIHEEGCEYLLGLFAYSEQSASLLILHYYQYLVRNQSDIKELGAIIKIQEGHKLAVNLGLNPTLEKSSTPQAYRSPFKDAILNPRVLAILFEKFVPRE